MTSILTILLKVSKVLHTESYADNLYFSHPNRNNMLGMKQMLDVYGIKTEGVKYEDRYHAELVFPCILHLPGTFVVGKDLSGDTVTYLYEGKEIQKSVEEFCEIWTGHALLPTSDLSEAIEPDYSIHHRKECVSKAFNVLLAAVPLLVWALGVIGGMSDFALFSILGCLFDWLGLILCYLLMEKQLFHSNNLGDKVCSAFHLNNCNNVLFSDKAKISGFSWSEIGFGYFAGRLFCHAFVRDAALPLSALGWTAMLYGIWSLWQQLSVLRQFCVLCTLVQVVVWVNGIMDFCLMVGHLSSLPLYMIALFQIVLVVLLAILSTHSIYTLYASEGKLHEENWKLKAFKSDPEVFLTKLHKEEHHETSDADSHVLLGNSESSMRITILTNPHCTPCARMHRRVEELLKNYGDRLCVQYIFSSFNKELEDSSRFLITVYQQKDKSEAQEVFRQWYEGKKNEAKEFMATIPVDIHASITDTEMLCHRKWRGRTGFTATPTILVNGYVLPELYEIEDLVLYIEEL